MSEHIAPPTEREIRRVERRLHSSPLRESKAISFKEVIEEFLIVRATPTLPTPEPERVEEIAKFLRLGFHDGVKFRVSSEMAVAVDFTLQALAAYLASSELPIDEDQPVGYKKPPIHSQFKPGVSGNPKGRPKNI